MPSYSDHVVVMETFFPPFMSAGNCSGTEGERTWTICSSHLAKVCLSKRISKFSRVTLNSCHFQTWKGQFTRIESNEFSKKYLSIVQAGPSIRGSFNSRIPQFADYFLWPKSLNSRPKIFNSRFFQLFLENFDRS